jgi:protein-disulfide isomerase
MNKKTSDPQTKLFLYSGAAVIVLLIIYIAGLAIFFLFPKQKANSKTVNYNKLIAPAEATRCAKSLVTKAPTRQKITHPQVSPEDPQLGAQTAAITIIEYSDFNCSYCANVQSILNELFIKYPDKIKLVWKNLPIKYIYPTSEMAAIAALCAGKQDKFWQYHDLLFANQNNFSKDAFVDFAKELNLDTENFFKCLDDEATLPRVKQTMQEAEDLNINGTPHFYINQQEIVGAADLDSFIDIIDIELGG